MRNLALVAVVLLVSTAAFAQQDKRNGLYVFVGNPGFTTSDRGGTSWDAAFGLALQRMFTPHLSGEVTVSRDRHAGGYTIYDSTGRVLENHRFVSHSTPVDVTARYHFFTDGAWKPYAGLGARVVESRSFAGVTGGVVWQFRPALGLRFDAKVILGGDQPGYNETLNGAVGLAWRF